VQQKKVESRRGPSKKFYVLSFKLKQKGGDGDFDKAVEE
jgi:hypothetical protein